ncbi:MAG: type VI secretion system-associated FHA domain protein TagH [Rhodobacteraceae bacterium]|nr:type VI secretion system-associated FHA domain protein TagH [Paracoccaceae bacterium]
MRGPSLTIGRGAENDLVLPDPNRELSKRHCAIEDHNGNVIVVDFSTNGTFLNYGKLALGSTPTPLNDGDILSIGPYELMVSIASTDTQEVIADPLDDMQVSPGQADRAPSPADLLDAPGDGGDFLEDLLGSSQSPVGPGVVKREDPYNAAYGDDGLLPPLGEEDGILPPIGSDPFAGQGSSQGVHNPAAQDHFRPNTPQQPYAIPDDWDDDLLSPGGGDPRSSDPFSQPQPEPEPQPQPQPAPSVPGGGFGHGAQTAHAATIPPASAMGGGAAGDNAARAFLEALGADDVQLSDSDLVLTMQRMGNVMRIMIEGMREILMTRSSIKSEFRIEHTMIQVGGNNPLKFSLSTEQAIESMVRPRAKGYLEASEAATQALNDIKAHEVAVISGMEAAMRGILRKLDPAVLEDRLTSDSSLSGILKSRKARYWEIYEDMYSEISDQAENDFHELFAKEFARAYQEQLEKLK